MKKSFLNSLKKKNLKRLALGVGTAALLASAGSANAATVVSFTFESLASNFASTGVSSGNYTADLGTGTAVGIHAAATTVWSSPAGSGSARSLSANVWAPGDYYQFSLNSTTYQDLTVAFDMAKSGTGPATFNLTYSTDGTTFTNYTSVALGTGSFSSGATSAGTHYSFDLSAVDTIENQSTLVFRLVDAAGTTATGGTSRIDNFNVTGTAVPEPSTVALMSMAGAAALYAARRRKASV